MPNPRKYLQNFLPNVIFAWEPHIESRVFIRPRWKLNICTEASTLAWRSVKESRVKVACLPSDTLGRREVPQKNRNFWGKSRNSLYLKLPIEGSSVNALKNYYQLWINGKDVLLRRISRPTQIEKDRRDWFRNNYLRYDLF